MDWHARYTQQAGWTASLRSYLFQQAGLNAGWRILEVGCGTGAVLADFSSHRGAVHGIDLDIAALRQARRHAIPARFACADALDLPYASASFDAVYSHYTLLWLSDPALGLMEMRRVTRPGGVVLALAEPDYGGRVDYPLELASLGRMQTDALRSQGADPLVGRKLMGLFSRAGLRHIYSGVIGGQWHGQPSRAELSLEWQTLTSDLAGQAAPSALEAMRALDERAWAHQERVLYVPTFYAWGVV